MPPHPLVRGEGTHACGRGVGGVPIPTRGHTLRYSVYASTLWSECKQTFNSLVATSAQSALWRTTTEATEAGRRRRRRRTVPWDERKPSPRTPPLITDTTAMKSHQQVLYTSTRPVERLYCKRPILCLVSSKILTPHPPHRPASVYPFCAGGGHKR